MTAPTTRSELLTAADVEWLDEIANAEQAVERLLQAKRRVLFADPVLEQVLWVRHIDRLRILKRKMDAICI